MEARVNSQSAAERFRNKIEVMESGCHEWRSTMHRDGYGKFWLGKPIQAHRASWLIFRGPIPADRHVCHTCDNRKCVNPDHLYLGTPSENVRDKVKRYPGLWGRMKYGPAHHAEVKRLRQSGLTQQAIAAQVGMDQTTVSRIVRGVGLIAQKEMSQ